MSNGPLSNATPTPGKSAYQPNDPGNVSTLNNPDGSNARAAAEQHPRAHAPAPVIRDDQGRIVPGSGRKPGK